ncbi:P-loop containing nucleoside triphosphate hydrolase protein [Viridothelium virens]|uniref:P-loop containing nucleoside triphosphate hydrolase protein n=1 Tax=Viridothelium virens TaxID=1048519 RepID=A0A6A6GVR0_VIRVR|nr:P-loop containing nucleoside triphosphate hydrolase protein [Viridothelium virens]
MAQQFRRRPCHFFSQPGGCAKGDSCTFSHEVRIEEFQQHQPICRHFLRGSCTYGEKCKFSHQQKEQDDMKAETISQASSLQSELRAWRSLLPSSNKNVRPLGNKISHFFQQGFRLIYAEPAIMQKVVEALSSEGGLARIKELVEVQLESCSEEQLATVFSSDFLPFFQTITSPDVLASHVLEKHVGTIYNYLFGHGGNCALGLYEHLARMFKYMSDSALPDQVLEKLQPNFATCLGAAIAVLAKLIDTNGTAGLNEEFHRVVETLARILGNIGEDKQEHFRVLRTRQQLLRIEQRLGLGQDMAVAGPLVNIDGPGWLSKGGCRHDNDFEDISKIRILPTGDEIRSHRQEYLPLMDPAQLHLGGIEGLLDRHFRLLREDTVGQLRNAIRLELHNSSDTKEIRQAIRTYAYQNLRSSTIEMDQRKGLRFLVSFDQPAALHKLNEKADRERQEWWETSKRLQAESLVCILNSEEAVIFCTVRLLAHEQGESHSGSGVNLNFRGQRDRAHAVLRLVETDEHNIRQLLGLSQAQIPQAKNSLIEFLALQTMSATLDLPFADMLAPSSAFNHNQIRIPPPIYTTDRNFRFDLSCLMNEDNAMTLAIREQFDLDRFRQSTSLDYAQASAVVDALTRSVALIQGPPGTGKGFTGVALIKVLLENAKSGDIGPVICVCYTNHALDQLLEQLLAHGIEQIIRIGSQSKSELLQPLNLWTVMKMVDRTQMERGIRAELAKKLTRDTEYIQSLLEELGRAGSVISIEEYLKVNYPNQYRQLFSDEDEEGFTFVYRKENAIDDWLHARHPKTTDLGESAGVTRPLAELLTADVHDMSMTERDILYRYWTSGIVDDLRDQLTTSLLDYRVTSKEHEHVQDDLKLRCLKQAKIIGLTTTGLAKNVSLFRRLRSKVLICEEADEVLEAHLFTALLPSIEQAIFIGDPQQLRPQIQNYELSRENYEGEKYSLDLSLFERLIQPQESWPGLPYSVLQTQRRMHPGISHLIRETLYPQLEDAETVVDYPEVPGIRKRLYWLDHSHLESGEDEKSTSSHSNDFEVEMVTALVSHLTRQSVYQPNDIAVLTPYLGQLHKLRQSLMCRCEIVVNDRDAQDLDAPGLEEPLVQQRSETARTTLLNAVRIATVDNFQGEEAKVVVISLVRSNAQNRCGFLKTSNRINVLLSRAKHGMYIIGNSLTYEGVQMWNDMLRMLRESRNVGPELELQCSRHPETLMNVSIPDDFLRLAPEGGCTEMCAKRLTCGHKCLMKCHSETLHNAVVCLEPCTRSMNGCDHGCPRRCGEPCEEKCMVELEKLNIILTCGHVITKLPCWQVQDPSKIACKEEVLKTVPFCGHKVILSCDSDVESRDFACDAVCNAILPCGHPCRRRCRQCLKRFEGVVKLDHGVCQAICDRAYTTCSHRCTDFCHGKDCPPCQQPCEVRCAHSLCAKKCSDSCAPCAESSCLSRWPHSACTMPCAAPCDWIPCSKRCEKSLNCGHPCPSVCGEQCPDAKYCHVCASDDIRETQVDYIEGKTYNDIDPAQDPVIFPQCGHFITVSNMDGQMDMARHYTMAADGSPNGLRGESEPLSDSNLGVKSCPQCRSSLRNVSRYGRIVRRALLDEATKKFIIAASRDYVPLAKRLLDIQGELQSTTAEQQQTFVLARTEKVKLEGSPAYQAQTIAKKSRKSTRYKPTLTLRRTVQKHLDSVRVQEQPFRRVWDMVQTARRLHSTAQGSFKFSSSVLHTTSELRATALLFRCDITLLSDFVKQQQQLASGEMQGELSINLVRNRRDSLVMIETAESAGDILRQMEGHFFFASFVAIERMVRGEETGDLKERALEHIKTAEALPDNSDAGYIQGVLVELEEVKRALNEGIFYSVVQNEEWRAVVSATSQEFSTTGHWYRCLNGHPFAIGECGRPMENTRCPECGAPVDGQHHQAAEGVEQMHGLEQEFSVMGIE